MARTTIGTKKSTTQHNCKIKLNFHFIYCEDYHKCTKSMNFQHPVRLFLLDLTHCANIPNTVYVSTLYIHCALVSIVYHFHVMQKLCSLTTDANQWFV